MVIIQARSRRKVSGGRYVASRKKRLFEKGSIPTLPKIGELKKKTVRVIGGNTVVKTMHTNIANVYDAKTKKHQKLKINSVIENPANRHYVRRNVITKGTIITTDKGNARVTSRPGQEGTVNAVLV